MFVAGCEKIVSCSVFTVFDSHMNSILFSSSYYKCKKDKTPGLIGSDSEYKILKNIFHRRRNFTKVLQIAKVRDYIPYVGKTDQGVTFFLHPIHYLIMN